MNFSVVFFFPLRFVYGFLAVSMGRVVTCSFKGNFVYGNREAVSSLFPSLGGKSP